MILRRKYNGAKIDTEVVDSMLVHRVVEERSICAEGISARSAGAYRSEHAGMSSDKSGENPLRRKSKVSYAMLVIVGLVGS